MTAIKFALEKSIFEPGEERLIKAIHVSQLEKKKKTYFLCLSVSRDKSGFISTVKKLDKDSYKKKRTWGLQDLRMVDGKDGKRVCIISLVSARMMLMMMCMMKHVEWF